MAYGLYNGDIRPEKGRSLITFPEDYVVVDIETTGLSPQYNEIIELSAIRYSGGYKSAEYTTLVRPDYDVSPFITDLTGITNEMLEDAPKIKNCLGEFSDFVGSSIVVGYNVNFDVNFIYDNFERWLGESFTNDFVDVMRIAKKELPALERHRQIDIADFFGIEFDRAHRALDDCETCNCCFTALARHITARGKTLEEFCKTFRNNSPGVCACRKKAYYTD